MFPFVCGYGAMMSYVFRTDEAGARQDILLGSVEVHWCAVI